jgi:hypothetical protein
VHSRVWVELVMRRSEAVSSGLAGLFEFADLMPYIRAVRLSHVCRMSVATYSRQLTPANVIRGENDLQAHFCPWVHEIRLTDRLATLGFVLWSLGPITRPLSDTPGSNRGPGWVVTRDTQGRRLTNSDRQGQVRFGRTHSPA